MLINYLKNRRKIKCKEDIFKKNRTLVDNFINFCEKNHDIQLIYRSESNLEIKDLLETHNNIITYFIIDEKLHIDYCNQEIIIRNAFRKMTDYHYSLNYDMHINDAQMLHDKSLYIFDLKEFVEVTYLLNNDYYLFNNPKIDFFFDKIHYHGFCFDGENIILKNCLKFVSNPDSPFIDIDRHHVNIRIIIEENTTIKNATVIKIFFGSYNNLIFSKIVDNNNSITALINLFFGMNLTVEGNNVLQLNHWSEFNQEHLETLKLITY